jgi:hypothetical protein
MKSGQKGKEKRKPRDHLIKCRQKTGETGVNTPCDSRAGHGGKPDSFTQKGLPSAYGDDDSSLTAAAAAGVSAAMVQSE